MRLSTKFLFFVFIVVILMTAGGAYLVYRGGIAALVKEEIISLEHRSSSAMDKVDSIIFERMSEMAILATSPTLNSGDISPEKIKKRMLQFTREYKYFVSMSFFDKDRVRVADTLESHVGYPAPPHAFWEELLNGKESTASDVSFSPSTGSIVIFFGSPVKSEEGELRGYVVGRLPIDLLGDTIRKSTKRHSEKQKHKIDLIDRNGLILWSNHDKEGVFEKNLSGLDIVRMSRAKSADIGGASFSGEICVFAREKGYHDFPGNGWTLILRTPEVSVCVPALALSWKLVFYMVAIGTVALAASFLFTRTILKPLRELRKGALVIGRGDLEYRLEISSGDEIGEVSEAFNIMVGRMQAATDKLEAANKELEAFSYSVSHDLRTPLRSMDGFSALLLENYSDKLDDKGKDYLTRVRKGAVLMAQLIDDMLMLSRVTRKDLSRVNVDLSAVASELIAEFRKAAPGRRVDVAIQGQLIASGDRDLLKAAIRNLLANAWKFTSKTPNAKIKFGSVVKDGEKVFFVRDNGAGFDMKYADKLFGVFQRLHKVSEFSGTGVGLAIVKRVVSKHGGKVWASGEEGKGAEFFFTLPERV